MAIHHQLSSPNGEPGHSPTPHLVRPRCQRQPAAMRRHHLARALSGWPERNETLDTWPPSRLSLPTLLLVPRPAVLFRLLDLLLCPVVGTLVIGTSRVLIVYSFLLFLRQVRTLRFPGNDTRRNDSRVAHNRGTGLTPEQPRPEERRPRQRRSHQRMRFETHQISLLECGGPTVAIRNQQSRRPDCPRKSPHSALRAKGSHYSDAAPRFGSRTSISASSHASRNACAPRTRTQAASVAVTGTTSR